MSSRVNVMNIYIIAGCCQASFAGSPVPTAAEMRRAVAGLDQGFIVHDFDLAAQGDRALTVAPY